MSYQPHSSYPSHAGYGAVATTSEERSLAVLAHLATIVALVVSAGWLSFVGPLAVWAWQKDKSQFVRRSAANAFNFNISMWVLAVIGWVLTVTVVLSFIGIPLLVIAAIAQLVFHIVGAVRANRGELYDYPLTLVRILS